MRTSSAAERTSRVKHTSSFPLRHGLSSQSHLNEEPCSFSFCCLFHTFVLFIRIVPFLSHSLNVELRPRIWLKIREKTMSYHQGSVPVPPEAKNASFLEASSRWRGLSPSLRKRSVRLGELSESVMSRWDDAHFKLVRRPCHIVIGHFN